MRTPVEMRPEPSFTSPCSARSTSLSEDPVIRWIFYGVFLLLPLVSSACPKRAEVAKEAEALVEVVGWNTIGAHQCYRPPDFASAESRSARRVLRGNALSEVSKRWRGKIESTFELDSTLVEEIESFLLTSPKKIESVLPREFANCSSWARGEISLEEHKQWYKSLHARLEHDACQHPPFELITQYIEVDQRWQIDIPICEDESVSIEGSKGQYTVEYKGDDESTRWITAEGDRESPSEGSGAPCTHQDCYKGQLIGRFVDRDNNEQLFPIGHHTYFTAPAHGRLSFAINDDSLYDNRFRTVNRVEEYLLIEIRPARASDTD